MKTTVIASANANGQNIDPAITAKANTPSLGGNVAGIGDDKVNGLPLGKELAGDKPSSVEAKSENNGGVAKMDSGEKTEVKPHEQSKAEIREGLVKPALNLEGTLKLVEELHRRKIQRDKLLSTIGTLEEFEVAQKDDAEETDSNHFQGCELTIEDDQRRTFSTKNPYIIKKVAEYVNALCLDKLAEIEGEIFLPA